MLPVRGLVVGVQTTHQAGGYFSAVFFGAYGPTLYLLIK